MASRQAVAIGCALVAGSLSAWVLAERLREERIEAAFWFEDVTFESPRLDGGITIAEMEAIEGIAREELTQAFAGLPIAFSDRDDATFQVRVVQELQDLRFDRRWGIAGESRAVSGFGGRGAVSFVFLASSAVAFAPADADRPTIVAAIGRGIGRSAVHEFAHQFLPTTPIHASSNSRSYEFASADRYEQYYGPMEWDLAWPLLEKRIRR